MIARMWRASTGGPQATERYRQVFEAEVAEALRGVAGFNGAYLLAREMGELQEQLRLQSSDGGGQRLPIEVDRDDDRVVHGTDARRARRGLVAQGSGAVLARCTFER